MNVLMIVITAWLAAHFNLPVINKLPDVKFATAQEMAKLRYGALASDNQRQLVAIYDDRAGTIYLPDGWTGATPAEMSVLVHEMVHHVQNLAGLEYQCPGAREALAYAAQEKWLALFGKSLRSEFEIDALTLKLTTTCM